MKLMKFHRDTFYNDPDVPLYESGKTYEIEDGMIAKWMKRGAEIVEDIPVVVKEPNKEVKQFVAEEIPKVVEVEQDKKASKKLK